MFSLKTCTVKEGSRKIKHLALEKQQKDNKSQACYLVNHALHCNSGLSFYIYNLGISPHDMKTASHREIASLSPQNFVTSLLQNGNCVPVICNSGWDVNRYTNDEHMPADISKQQMGTHAYLPF